MTLGEFYSLACAVAWAVAIIIFRFAAENVPAQHLNLLKNTVMLVLLVPTMLLTGSSLYLEQHDLLISLFSGFIGIAIGDALYLAALQQLGASRAGIAGMMYSPWVVLLSAWWLGESLSTGQWWGLLLVLLGLAVVALAQTQQNHSHSTPLSWPALGIAAAAMALMAAGIVIVKPVLERAEFLTVVWYRVVAGTLPAALWMLRPRVAIPLFSARAWQGVERWGLLLTGCVAGTYIAMMLWLAGYKYASASVAAVLNESAALWIMLLAWLVLGDRLSPRQVVGAGVLAVGVAMVLLY